MKKLGLVMLAASATTFAFPALAQPGSPGANVMVRQGGGFMRPGMHPGANFRHHRLQRGFSLHPFWFGPQFHVQNWQLYGFAAPQRDQRWVRYYDDAYLIDGQGRVADTRYDLDWDEYGEDWSLDDGIPHYEGRNDWRPGDDDYAWVEGQRGDRRYGRADYDDDYADHGRRQPMPQPGCHQGPQPCGAHGYAGYAYPGYGYGVAYPIIIETTVTTSGCDCEEVVEEVVVRQAPHRRPRVRTVRPRPPAGERG